MGSYVSNISSYGIPGTQRFAIAQCGRTFNEAHRVLDQYLPLCLCHLVYDFLPGTSVVFRHWKKWIQDAEPEEWLTCDLGASGSIACFDWMWSQPALRTLRNLEVVWVCASDHNHLMLCQHV